MGMLLPAVGETAGVKCLESAGVSDVYDPARTLNLAEREILER